MRRWWGGGLAFAVLVAACGGPGEIPEDGSTVEDAAVALSDALQTGDAEALDALLADDFLWVRNNGATGSKREFIAALTDPSLRLDPIRLDDVTWTVGSTTALSAGEATLSGRLNGERVTDHHRFADFWVWRDGRWRLAYAQTTPLPVE
ncbi:MAG TPA: nuclear transport factor 2 family protein [Alphaproteobacteria bacterium]|mgnify:CR=1 FL=1|nr:nuclear transport factor 2 family protein [Alphaproteobacteria bacterium]